MAGDAVEEGEGGGIHLYWDADADIINTTIVENEADLGAGIFYHACNPTVVNSVLWDNTPDAIGHYPTSGGIAITYSDVEGGGYAGAGNIDADPLFADSAYHLAPSSPCIDTGTVSGAPETDYEGDPRLTAVIGENQPDMGADEVIPPLPDLIVESITTVPVDPDPGEAFTVIVTIKNQGEGNFSAPIQCAYALTPPPSIYSRWYIWYGLNAGESSQMQFQYASGKPVGTHTLQAIADYGTSVTESNEANNSRSTTLRIDALPDAVPPSPDPMTWSVKPYETSTSVVSMTSTRASDPTPPVEYLFVCMVSGCHSSGWQPGTAYTDSGLLPNSWYGWRVKARDGNANETGYSLTSYDYTDIETPNGVSFSIDVGSTYIYARSANTPSGLDRSGSGLILYNLIAATDSGWKQDNDWWLSDGLSPNTSYIFRARARNGDGDVTPLSNYYYRLTRAVMPGTDSYTNITPTSIQANWTANGNPPGTEYYCESKISATNSGWTTDTFWDSTGLVCGQLHAFRVRDRNAEGVTTDWTALGDQETLPCQAACEGDFEPDGDVDGSDLAEEARTMVVDIGVFAVEFGRTNCP